MQANTMILIQHKKMVNLDIGSINMVEVNSLKVYFHVYNLNSAEQVVNITYVNC